MKAGDYFYLVFSFLKRRKLRNFLTMLGIVIGITIIISLISVGKGTEEAFLGVFSKLGYDTIIILPKGAIGPMTSELSASKLRDSDAETIEKVRGVEEVIRFITNNKMVTYKGESKSSLVSGVSTDKDALRIYEEKEIIKLKEGRLFKENEKYKAILGYNVWKKLFDKEVKVKDKIEIGGKSFEVIGLQEKTGNPTHDNMIRIPIKTMKEVSDAETYTSFLITIKKGFDVHEVADEIKKELRKSRGEKENEETFEVKTNEERIREISTILNQINLFFISLAAMSLIVGGFGVMNTMFTAVSERTKEIGIMKAIGAKGINIFVLFSIESGVIGLIGGIFGVGLGIILSKIIEIIAKAKDLPLNASISINVIALSLSISLILGVLFGIIPAIRAAKLRPVEAIRK